VPACGSEVAPLKVRNILHAMRLGTYVLKPMEPCGDHISIPASRPQSMRAPGLRVAVSVVAALLVLSYLAYTVASTPGVAMLANPPSSFTVNGRASGITYIATDQNSREAGLMNRRITDATTMLFVFPSPGRYSFWMSRVNSTLDIIWLNVTGNVGTVVYVVRSAPACSSPFLCPVYQPTAPANWVIETKGGFAEANGIEAGTVVRFS